MNYTATRQYNNLLQTTRLTAAGGSQGSLDLEYKFSSTQNNGRITAMKDWVTGEEVQYTYDALQRLTRAETVGPEWGSTYGYDGFGNLLQKTPVKGSGVPLLNIAVDPWTNRVSGLSGGSCDANGNDLTAGAFDIANRLKQSGSTYFQYDAANKRVWKGTVAGGAITSEEFYFYAPWGAKLAAYKPTNYLNLATMTIVSSNEYFRWKLIKINGTGVLTDRLGSNVSNGKRYFPYGEERGSTANNIEKFGTYFRDAETGLDYADQRYYKGSWGRFSGPLLGVVCTARRLHRPHDQGSYGIGCPDIISQTECDREACGLQGCDESRLEKQASHLPADSSSPGLGYSRTAQDRPDARRGLGPSAAGPSSDESNRFGPGLVEGADAPDRPDPEACVVACSTLLLTDWYICIDSSGCCPGINGIYEFKNTRKLVILIDCSEFFKNRTEL